MIDGVINIVTSPGVYFTEQILTKKFRSVNYTLDDVINHLLLSRPVTGISFNLMPLVEPKLFNFLNIS